MPDLQPVACRICERPAFRIAGRQTFISGPDNDQFGRFWDECRKRGWLNELDQIKKECQSAIGPQTRAAYLGVSRVEKEPDKRDFYYMIGVELPDDTRTLASLSPELETYRVPASTWAVFECHGKPPMSIVTAEMFAFGQWLPSSEYRHAMAPEMEVYPADKGSEYAEFWLPVELKNALDHQGNVPPSS